MLKKDTFQSIFCPIPFSMKNCSPLLGTYHIRPNPNNGGDSGAEVTVVVSVREENVPQTPIVSEVMDVPEPRGNSLPYPKVANDYDTDYAIGK